MIVLTTEQIEAARRMRSDGNSWRAIAGVVGTTAHLLRTTLDPSYSRAFRERAAKQTEARRKPARPSSHEPGPSLKASEVERMASRLPPDTRSPMQVFLGDPRPGRALMRVDHG